MVINQFMVHAYMKFMKNNNNFIFYTFRKTKIFHIFLREEKPDEGVQFGQRRMRKQKNN